MKTSFKKLIWVGVVLLVGGAMVGCSNSETKGSSEKEFTASGQYYGSTQYGSRHFGNTQLARWRQAGPPYYRNGQYNNRECRVACETAVCPVPCPKPATCTKCSS